jgi:hypothetical protein
MFASMVIPSNIIHGVGMWDHNRWTLALVSCGVASSPNIVSLIFLVKIETIWPELLAVFNVLLHPLDAWKAVEVYIPAHHDFKFMKVTATH